MTIFAKKKRPKLKRMQSKIMENSDSTSQLNDESIHNKSIASGLVRPGDQSIQSGASKFSRFSKVSKGLSHRNLGMVSGQQLGIKAGLSL